MPAAPSAARNAAEQAQVPDAAASPYVAPAQMACIDNPLFEAGSGDAPVMVTEANPWFHVQCKLPDTADGGPAPGQGSSELQQSCQSTGDAGLDQSANGDSKSLTCDRSCSAVFTAASSQLLAASAAGISAIVAAPPCTPSSSRVDVPSPQRCTPATVASSSFSSAPSSNEEALTPSPFLLVHDDTTADDSTTASSFSTKAEFWRQQSASQAASRDAAGKNHQGTAAPPQAPCSIVVEEEPQMCEGFPADDAFALTVASHCAGPRIVCEPSSPTLKSKLNAPLSPSSSSCCTTFTPPLSAEPSRIRRTCDDDCSDKPNVKSSRAAFEGEIFQCCDFAILHLLIF